MRLMAARHKLSDGEVSARLSRLSGWTLSGAQIQKTYQFRDFSEAFGFMARAALAAERRDHHPDWSNSWSRVVVSLSTHDASGLTELDFEMAEEFDRLIPR